MGFFTRLTGWEPLYGYFEGKWVNDRVSGRRGLVVRDYGQHYPCCEVVWEKTDVISREFKSQLRTSDNQEDSAHDPNLPPKNSPPPRLPSELTSPPPPPLFPKSTRDILAAARAAAAEKANKREL